MTVSDATGALEALVPLGLAEPWDCPGLQVGDPAAPLEAALVALDPSPAAVGRAIECKAQLLVTHHPLLLSPLSRLDLSQPLGRLLAECIGSGLSIYASHTNLDRADGGVNDGLASQLGLVDVEPLSAGEERLKLVVTVPAGYEQQLRRALARAGAGRIGRYDACAFSCRGTGAFRPMTGATPFAGRIGEDEEVDEVRIETEVSKSRLALATRAVLEAHPYEEPVVDVYPLSGRCGSGGLGRVGNLLHSVALEDWAATVARTLGVPALRFVGDSSWKIRRVAVCGGSGATLWPEARRAGAQVLVTGDVKYHTAREANDAGLALVDAGHWASELVSVDILAGILEKWSRSNELGLRVETFREADPFRMAAA